MMILNGMVFKFKKIYQFVIKFLTMIWIYYCKFHMSKISFKFQFYNKMFVWLRDRLFYSFQKQVYMYNICK